ncbi:NAD(P)-binding protein, partial [Imleria badia]
MGREWYTTSSGNLAGWMSCLVANAGVWGLSPLISTELDEWERIMAVNARGTFLCYKYAAQQMIKQGRGGRIMGASSIVGKLGKPLFTAYSASKFAIRGLTQTAALELGPYNITVNSYAPGPIKTPMTAGLLDTIGEFAKADPEMVDLWRSRAATKGLKYDGQPEDIASLVSYLASKEAHFITGRSVSPLPFCFLNKPLNWSRNFGMLHEL